MIHSNFCVRCFRSAPCSKAECRTLLLQLALFCRPLHKTACRRCLPHQVCAPSKLAYSYLIRASQTACGLPQSVAAAFMPLVREGGTRRRESRSRCRVRGHLEHLTGYWREEGRTPLLPSLRPWLMLVLWSVEVCLLALLLLDGWLAS